MNSTRHPTLLLQVFSISVQLNEKNPYLSCTIDDNGFIKPCSNSRLGNSTSISSQDQGCSESSYPEFTSDRCIQLYGTITASDTGGLRLFYQREKESPECIHNHDTISHSDLMPKYCLTCFYFDMRFDLKDAEQDLEVSRGYLFRDGIDIEPYYSKRLCEVIPGKDGSASVYYSIFRKAIQAFVEVELSIDGHHASSAFVVYGSIYNRYSGHDYSSEYDRKYYRTALFRKPQHHASPLTSNCEVLPLSVYLVAVPIDTSLIIVADLHVMSDGIEVATISDDAVFPQDDNNTPSTQTIVGQHGLLNVAVNWSNFGDQLLYRK